MAKTEVHNLFLLMMAAIYLFAFASLYHQLPGLYGETGILPATIQLPQQKNLDTIGGPLLTQVWKVFNTADKPTLLWITQAIGLDVDTGMDLLAVSGMVLASVAIIFRLARNFVFFGLMWLLYLSLHSVGNTFLWFQWDALLLEAGFLAFVFAPIPVLTTGALRKRLAPLSMWPVRWLFFRLMFMSGVVKMQSQCPTWWKLTALHHHYESQCLPTFVGWYIHQLPDWFDKLTVLHALFSEIVVPFLFFAPTRGLRKFAFYNQVVLQLGIILTGNYNFFNLLTIVLSLSLLDDQDLGYIRGRRATGWFGRIIAKLFNCLLVGGLLVGALILFNARYDKKDTMSFKAGFTNADFNRAIALLWPASVALAFLSLLWNMLQVLRAPGMNVFAQLYHTVFILFHFSAALALFGLSLSPYSSLSPSTHLGMLDKPVRTVHRSVDKYNLVNGYGLFRRMTGVEGRPELLLEGSDDLDGNWTPYSFRYKPGDLDRAPAFLIPHQPRLDWQMWFAALGDQRMNPWIHNLIYRLLKGEKSVIRLLDPATPFAKTPPKYVRGVLYKYWFTRVGESSRNWWRRTLDRTWLSPVSLEDETFMKTVRSQGMELKSTKRNWMFSQLKEHLHSVRDVAEYVQAPVFIWSIFMMALLMNRILKSLRL